MDLYPGGEYQQFRRRKRENAGSTPEGTGRIVPGGIPATESIGTALILPPVEMRTLRTVLRNGGCFVYHLGPAGFYG